MSGLRPASGQLRPDPPLVQSIAAGAGRPMPVPPSKVGPFGPETVAAAVVVGDGVDRRIGESPG